jgi:hypothetical protein
MRTLLAVSLMSLALMPVRATATNLSYVVDDGTGLLAISSTPGASPTPLFLWGPRGDAFLSGRARDVADIDPLACRISRRWRSAGDLLRETASAGANLIRLFPWLCYWPEQVFPFERDRETGKLLLRQAAQSDRWNEAYFEAVSRFVHRADALGVVVMFTLFDHIGVRVFKSHLDGRPWAASPIRRANSADGWGLDDHPREPGRRAAEFFRFRGPDGSLTDWGRLQEAWVRRVVRTLDTKNVILEVVNEPRQLNNPYLSTREVLVWEDWVVSLIRQEERRLGRRHPAPIGVVAEPLGHLDPYDGRRAWGRFDLLAWRDGAQTGDAELSHWPEVALVTYHGYYAYGNPPHFGDLARRYPRLRFKRHRIDFPDKALLYSTDGFSGGDSTRQCKGWLAYYLNQVRHGWWDRLDGGEDYRAFPLLWGVWIHSLMEPGAASAPVARPGQVHFNNWSWTAASIRDLARGPWNRGRRPAVR